MSEIKDLDILRPEKNIVKLGNQEIDVSFIPVGITFEVDKLMNKINSYGNKDQKELLEEDNINVLKELFNCSIDLCVLFCSLKHSDMNKDWFLNNTDPLQIKAFVDEIKKALSHSYEAVAKYGKN